MGRLPTPEKVREDRLRRMAQRQGFTFTKSRRRDPMACDYGMYELTRSRNGYEEVARATSLDDLERFLTARIDPARTAKPDTEETQ
jgi:hypothetical protein